jgi:hypothetical protein
LSPQVLTLGVAVEVIFIAVAMVKQHQVGAAKATWNPWNQLNDAQCTNKQDRHSYQHIQNGKYYHMYLYIYIPVVPHKAVAEVSKIGNL